MSQIEKTAHIPDYVHYSDVIMGAMASQITSPTVVYLIVYSDANQSKHQSSASLAFVRGIHRWPVNSPHKGPVTRKMFPFDDVIMISNNIFLHEIRVPYAMHFTGIYFHRTQFYFCRIHPDENVLKPIAKFPISYFY